MLFLLHLNNRVPDHCGILSPQPSTNVNTKSLSKSMKNGLLSIDSSSRNSSISCTLFGFTCSSCPRHPHIQFFPPCSLFSRTRSSTQHTHIQFLRLALIWPTRLHSTLHSQQLSPPGRHKPKHAIALAQPQLPQWVTPGFIRALKRVLESS